MSKEINEKQPQTFVGKARSEKQSWGKKGALLIWHPLWKRLFTILLGREKKFSVSGRRLGEGEGKRQRAGVSARKPNPTGPFFHL